MKIYFLSLFVILLLSISFLFAQENKSPFVVNPLIGDTLSLDERNFYQLFPQIEGFQWAVFYVNPDSSLNADVNYLIDGLARDTLIQNYKSLKTLNYHIYARNALENETPDRAFNYKTAVYSKGEDVNVHMTNGLEASGELLSVKENSLLIFNSSNCEDPSKSWECINQVKADDIDKLIIRGESNVLLGAGLGLLVALASGITIFYSNYDSDRFIAGRVAWNESKTAIILSSVISLGVGIGIGIATSTPDEVIEPFSEYEISGLSIYSKYPQGEPEELQKIE